MRIVKPDAKLISREDKTPMEMVEYAGRICYKSQDLITPGSAEKFCKRMIESRHLATLENGWIHLFVNVPNTYENAFNLFIGDAAAFKYVEVSKIENTNLLGKCFLVSGSFRGLMDAFGNNNENRPVFASIYDKLSKLYPVIFETHEYNFEDEDCKNISIREIQPSEVANILTDGINDKSKIKEEIMKHSVITIVFTCDRGVSHEIVRHRPASYCQESTRYCDYSKDKFNKEISVIFPEEYKEDKIKYSIWYDACQKAEESYFKLRELGATPQEARGVLPTDLKTEIVVTANEKEWQHIVNLRYHGKTGKPHPHMRSVMEIAFPLIRAASNFRVE